MSDETRVITLKCANCAANLEISNDMSNIACGYCGAQQIVERKGGTVFLKAISEALSKVQAGTDKTAAELAIRRLSEELSSVEAKAATIINSSNAASAGYSSNGNNGCLVTGLFTLLGAIAGAGLLSAGQKGYGATILTLGILIAVVGTLITRSFWASARRAREQSTQAIAPLREQIADLQGKLAKQRAIIDS